MEQEVKQGKSGFFYYIVGAILIAMIGVFAYMKWGGATPKLPVMKHAPEFRLENMDGRMIGKEELAGKAKLIYFFYSVCPDVCQPSTYTLSKVQEALVKQGGFGDKTAIVSISFDPTRDTPARLKEFAAQFRADPKGWFFLRGEEAPMFELAQQFGIMVVKDKEGGTFSHSNAFLLVDGKGDLRTYYNANDANLDVNKIAQDLLNVSKE